MPAFVESVDVQLVADFANGSEDGPVEGAAWPPGVAGPLLHEPASGASGRTGAGSGAAVADKIAATRVHLSFSSGLAVAEA